MKHMKKMLAIFLAVLMIFSLVSCGDKDDDKDGGRDGISSDKDKKTETVETSEPDTEEPKTEEPKGPSSAKELAKVFAKCLSNGDYVGANNLFDYYGIVALDIAQNSGITVEEAETIVSDLSEGIIYIQDHHSKIVKKMEKGGVELSVENVRSWNITLARVESLISGYLQSFKNLGDCRNDTLEKSGNRTDWDITPYWVNMINDDGDEVQTTLWIAKINGEYRIVFPSRHNEASDYEAMKSEEVMDAAPTPTPEPTEAPTPIPERMKPFDVRDNCFFIDYNMLGMTYDELSTYLGDSLPELQAWEWDAEYDQYMDYWYEGKLYSIFFANGTLRGIRYEIESDVFSIDQGMMSACESNFQYIGMRTRDDGSEIAFGENGYGYRFNSTKGYVVLFYNLYDEIPHTAMHYGY